jgi:SP family myo-inositol transporter-like MFS transporter 13
MGDRADEPLMGGGDGLEERAFEDDNRHSRTTAHGLEDGVQHPGLFVWLLTFSAGISGLLFGYDTGVISAMLVSIGTSLSQRPLSTLDKSLITASTSLFALLISPVSGTLADRFGRKKVILLADILFILGATMQASAMTVFGMVIGRSIVGLAVGAASFVVPLYIAELAPAKFRGRLVTLNILFVTSGQVVAYLIGWAFGASGAENGWRWMVGLGAVPAGVQCVVMVFMPESPRWLTKIGSTASALAVLEKVFRGAPPARRVAETVLRGIVQEVQEEEAMQKVRSRDESLITFCGITFDDSWTELFRVPGNRRALTIACLLQGLQQLCGFNSLMYFSATLFSLIGFSTPTLTALSVAVTNMLFTLLSLFLIDLLGRRRILLLSLPVMVLALLACAAAFVFINLPSDTNITLPESDGANSSLSAFLVVASIMIYVAAYAVGMGNVPWQQSELFPLNVRGPGSGVATATNWASNFIVGITFLPMLRVLSPSLTFAVYAGVCAVGWVAVWRIYPETNGLSLEETGELLRDGWGVRR